MIFNTSTNPGFHPKSLTPAELSEKLDELRFEIGADPLPAREPFSLDFGAPGALFPNVVKVRDEFIAHPDTLAQLPPQFVDALRNLGVNVRPMIFMQAGVFMLTGNVATLWQRCELSKRVEVAFAENSAFLSLLRRNGML